VDQWQDVRDLWGDALEPVDPALLGPNQSATTRDFLTAAGLPTTHPLDFEFYHDARLSAPVERGSRSYFTFGDDTGTVPFAIADGSDAVVSLYPDGPFMFINSTIADFVYSYGVFSQRVDRILELPVDDRKPLIDEIRDLIDARDPSALDPDGLLSWWEDLLAPYEEGQ
jgi:hypothetical protein